MWGVTSAVCLEHRRKDTVFQRLVYYFSESFVQIWLGQATIICLYLCFRKFISCDKNHFVFIVALFTFFKNKSKVFVISSLSLTLINFTRNLSNVFFYLVTLINFSNYMFNVFFLNIFYRPPSFDFGFFLI